MMVQKLSAVAVAIVLAAAVSCGLGMGGSSCSRLAGAEPRVGKETPKIEIAAKRADDVVKIEATDDKVVFDIRSPFGVSEAAFTRGGKDWPAGMCVRMHLAGLEHFEVGNGETTIHASASSSGEFKPRVWRDKDEQTPLTEKDSLFLAISRKSADRPAAGDKSGGGEPGVGAPAPTEKAVYFEMVLPKALFEHNPKTITIRWIDFYRG